MKLINVKQLFLLSPHIVEHINTHKLFPLFNDPKRLETLRNSIFSFELMNLSGFIYSVTGHQKMSKFVSTESTVKIMDLIYCYATKYSVSVQSFKFNCLFTQNLTEHTIFLDRCESNTL